MLELLGVIDGAQSVEVDEEDVAKVFLSLLDDLVAQQRQSCDDAVGNDGAAFSPGSLSPAGGSASPNVSGDEEKSDDEGADISSNPKTANVRIDCQDTSTDGVTIRETDMEESPVHTNGSQADKSSHSRSPSPPDEWQQPPPAISDLVLDDEISLDLDDQSEEAKTFRPIPLHKRMGMYRRGCEMSVNSVVSKSSAETSSTPIKQCNKRRKQSSTPAAQGRVSTRHLQDGVDHELDRVYVDNPESYLLRLPQAELFPSRWAPITTLLPGFNHTCGVSMQQFSAITNPTNRLDSLATLFSSGNFGVVYCRITCQSLGG